MEHSTDAVLCPHVSPVRQVQGRKASVDWPQKAFKPRDLGAQRCLDVVSNSGCVTGTQSSVSCTRSATFQSRKLMLFLAPLKLTADVQEIELYMTGI